MTMSQKFGGADRLSLHVKSAYWTALLLFAAMAVFSYLHLGRIVADQVRLHGLLSMVSEQRELVHRISSQGEFRSSIVQGKMEAVLSQLEMNHSRILAASRDPMLGAVFDPEINGILETTGRQLERAEKAKFEDGSSANAELFQAAGKVYNNLFARLSKLSVEQGARVQDHHRYLFLATIALIGLVIIVIFRPLTAAISRNAEELLNAHNSMAYLAAHDGLTGLHNRAFLLDHFQSLISGAIRRKERLAVVQFDLDGFKQINDTLGHAAGDYVLVETAKRLHDSCRASDMCVRLGGDEFVIVLNAVGDSQDTNKVVKRILQNVNMPMSYEGATINTCASAGIAVFPVDADNPDDLLIHADLALYEAKKKNAGTHVFFSSELREELENRKLLENDLQLAIRNRAFDVHFQPQLSLAEGSVVGIEALMRWNHPERGNVAPAEFIPIAEKTGLMVSIGRIVINKAIENAANWYREEIEFGRLSVNVSGVELREPDFSDFLFSALSNHGLPPEKLSLEIVESVILDDDRHGIATQLRTIRSAGIHLELDDFGTGYASLSHVNPNEIDRLKIDRRFIRNIATDSDNAKIVKAITELARGLGIAIIAEGAETEEELNQLSAIGCSQVQGFSLAYPMPENQAREWLTLRGKRSEPVKLKSASLASITGG